MARIGWYSNSPHIGSGYGQMTAQVLTRMKADGHDPACISNFGAAAGLNYNGIPVYADGLKQYSVDIFPKQLKAWGGISIGLFDSWPMVQVADQLTDLNLAWWVPIDHDPVPPGVVEFFSKSRAVAIAMTKFGERQLRAIGMPEEMVSYIPHAIDTKQHFVDVGQAGRAAMNIPADAHLVVMNAANRGRIPVRKAFGENLLAITNHLNRHPDAYAYIHTEPEGISDGMNLIRYLNFLRAPMERFRWPEPLAFRNGIPTEALKHLYSAGDIFVGTSMGEGFGIPTVEAAACGTRVVVSDFAGSAELCGYGGTLVGGQKSWDEFQGSYWIIPNVQQIEDALERDYHESRAKSVDRAKVREFALQYDADLVYQQFWRPFIAKMEARVLTPAATANRAERRAAKKKK